MIVIQKIDTYRDGGTIAIECYASAMVLTNLLNDETPMGGMIQVTIDYAAGTTTPGEWYLGLKNKNGRLITDDNFKDKLIMEIEKRIQREQFLVNKLINQRK